MRGIVVIGTSTDVGKTAISAALMKLASISHSPLYWKPVATGPLEDDDTAKVKKLSELEDRHFTPSTYHFSRPKSPHLAARDENQEIDISKLVDEARNKLAARGFLVLETAGGVHVPLNFKTLQIDFIAKLDLPAILVAHDQLGAINHTLLTLEACRSRNLKVEGVILNRKTKDWGNAESIAALGNVPVLAEVRETSDLQAIDELIRNPRLKSIFERP